MAIANKSKDRFFTALVRKGVLTVSKTGIVVNTLTGNRIGYLSGGYWRISFQHPRTRVIYKMMIHRLMWLVYVGPIPQGLVVNHKDGDSTRNRLSNFELATDLENTRHASRLGLLCAGPRMSNLVKEGHKKSGYTAKRSARKVERRQAFERKSKRPQSLNEGNSQFGSFWITNGFSSRKWTPDKGRLPKGYTRGRHSECNTA